MSQVDQENIESSEEQDQQSEKLVSVNEAIRYRKRAQSAEQKYQLTAQELSQSKQELESLNTELKESRCREELVKALATEGAADIETAVLVGKAKLEKNDGMEITDVVAQMKREKSYLFGANNVKDFAAPARTGGAKEKLPTGSAALERAAKRAAASGSRAALQEYLKARRLPLGR
ncbi:MAG: hypothetical protein K8R02_02830 [Anaerohalosphaeraceae bacterium]|nr:hypothetical protein [Anaerohalosphaeraceae bacterium]